VKDNVTTAVEVQVGAVREKLVPVAAGLAPGTTVVVNPPKDLADGRTVKAKAAG
jgi:hypothetical protein